MAGLSDRRVRYWLARYRVEGAGIYDDEAVDPGTGATAAAPKKRPDILPSDTMTEAAAKTLKFHLAKMLEHEEGTRLGEDPEELHDMRVSTRRMRMALRVFADYLDPDVLRPVLKGLRRTGRTLGAVRDLDVFDEKTQVYLDGLPDERAGDLDGLLEAWKAERDKQREHLVAYLDGKRYRRFVERTQELLDGPAEALAPRNIVTPRPQRVAQVLPGVLYKDMAVVWAFEGQLGGLETPLPRFHALRKACKGLRYTLEFFEDVLGPGARPLIKRVKGLQDHLGDLQDAVVTCGVLRDYITWGTWRHEGHELPGPIEIIVARGRRPLPHGAPGGDGAPGADVPGGVADGRRQRVQPRARGGDRRDLARRAARGQAAARRPRRAGGRTPSRGCRAAARRPTSRGSSRRRARAPA